MPIRTNPSPRPLTLRSGRVLAARETAQVSDDDATTVGLAAPPVDRPSEPVSEPAAEPAAGPPGNASRQVWADHARTVGVDVPTDATRDDIRAAVAAHTEES